MVVSRAITLVLAMIALNAIQGISQKTVKLTRNTDSTVFCSNDDKDRVIEYTCRVNGSLGQWIIGRRGDSAIGHDFISASIFTDQRVNLREDPRITVEQDFANSSIPLLIFSVRIPEVLVEEVTSVTCLNTVDGTNSTMTLTSADDIVGVPGEVKLTPMVADFDGGAIMVQFNLSPSGDIVGYTVNCSKNSCMPVFLGPTQSSGVIYANSSIGGKSHMVGVTAVNRCGVESPMVTNVMTLKTIESYSAIVIVFSISWFIFLIATLGLTVYFIIAKVKQNKAEGVQNLKELTKNEQTKEQQF